MKIRKRDKLLMILAKNAGMEFCDFEYMTFNTNSKSKYRELKSIWEDIDTFN